MHAHPDSAESEQVRSYPPSRSVIISRSLGNTTLETLPSGIFTDEHEMLGLL